MGVVLGTGLARRPLLGRLKRFGRRTTVRRKPAPQIIDRVTDATSNPSEIRPSADLPPANERTSGNSKEPGGTTFVVHERLDARHCRRHR
jgi:hypothetical protein